MSDQPAKITYADAGVDISAADRANELIKKHARTTINTNVLSDIGSFGGLFQLQGYKEPVLVSSVDGVGTKLKIAAVMGRHDTVGIDLVNHCINDILTTGASPLFFLDYVGIGKLFPDQVGDVVKGLSEACKDSGCVLIGGETAEMPGVYAEGDYDLVGCIVGAVEKSQILDTSRIKPGDSVIGLPSNGLHTNGYSLVRKVFGVGIEGQDSTQKLHAFHQELGCTLGDELLKPHRCYFNPIQPVLPEIKGLAHITGGGLMDNIPRSLPKDVSVHIKKGSWQILPIFEMIRKEGDIDEKEMYHVFNMGVGMVIFCQPEKTDILINALPDAKILGEVTQGTGQVLID